MRAAFTKMHGLGNDFVVLDTRAAPLPPVTAALARALADRRTGIGCDQLIVLEESSTADFRMRIYNADGGEVEACGNATRAVAILHGSPAHIETAGGILAVQPGEGGAAVDMGEPHFEWDAIPLAYAMDTAALPVGWDELEQPAAVNVGNPHAVFFTPGMDRPRVSSLFTRDVRYVEVREDGLYGGNVIPAEYDNSPEMIDVVRNNVTRAKVGGRLVANDEVQARVYGEFADGRSARRCIDRLQAFLTIDESSR